MKRAADIEDVTVNQERDARSCEWVEVTDRRREARFGEALTVRVARQSRSAGLKDVKQKRGVKGGHSGGQSFCSDTDLRVSMVLLR